MRNNDIEVSLRQNSPLQLTIQLSGDEVTLAILLTAYLRLAGTNETELDNLPVVSQRYVALPMNMEQLVQAYHEDLQSQNIQVTMREYYVQNFGYFIGNDEPIYYFNSSTFFPGRALANADGADYGTDI